jgi:hypothetical protein
MSQTYTLAARNIAARRAWHAPVIAEICAELQHQPSRFITASNPHRDIAAYVAARLFLADRTLAALCQPFPELHDMLHDRVWIQAHCRTLMRRVAHHVRSRPVEDVVQAALVRHFGPA